MVHLSTMSISVISWFSCRIRKHKAWLPNFWNQSEKQTRDQKALYQAQPRSIISNLAMFFYKWKLQKNKFRLIILKTLQHKNHKTLKHNKLKLLSEIRRQKGVKIDFGMEPKITLGLDWWHKCIAIFPLTGYEDDTNAVVLIPATK